MARVIVFGVGQLAAVAHFYLTHDSPHEVVAFTVDSSFLKERDFLGLPVVPFEEVETRFPVDAFKMFVPVSYRQVNALRTERYHQAKTKGYELISYVCSKAITWPGLTIGDNCFIFESNMIQPFVEIGNNVILWGGSHIGHHSTIGDHCFVASHVAVSGSVTIEPRCFLGVNSTIRDGIRIARECVIGAGALVLKDTEEKGVYVGRPAEKIGKRSDELKSI